MSVESKAWHDLADELPGGPTPRGVFVNTDRPVYNEAVDLQLAHAQESQGAGDLDKLLHSLGTWKVD